jgi:hypothetical protein
LEASPDGQLPNQRITVPDVNQYGDAREKLLSPNPDGIAEAVADEMV